MFPLQVVARHFARSPVRSMNRRARSHADTSAAQTLNDSTMQFSRSPILAGLLVAGSLIHAPAHAAPRPLDAGIYSSAAAPFNADPQIFTQAPNRRFDPRIFTRSSRVKKRWEPAPEADRWINDSIL
jgi:hypothetical protein